MWGCVKLGNVDLGCHPSEVSIQFCLNTCGRNLIDSLPVLWSIIAPTSRTECFSSSQIIATRFILSNLDIHHHHHQWKIVPFLKSIFWQSKRQPAWPKKGDHEYHWSDAISLFITFTFLTITSEKLVHPWQWYKVSYRCSLPLPPQNSPGR